MNDRIDDVVREFLGENTPSSELCKWRKALEARLNRLRAEAARDPQSREALHLKIEHLASQVKALREEEAITEFVEDSVRASAADAVSSVDQPGSDSGMPPWTSLDVDDYPEGH